MGLSEPGREIGILSDIEILARLVAKDRLLVFVSPLLAPEESLGPSSLDLRLGTVFILTRNIATPFIDLASKDKKALRAEIKRYSEERVIPAEGKFVLHPGEFVLATTLEYIKLPIDIAGRLEGRSSLGRLGIQVHSTAGFVDPGFRGHLTFELINSGKLPVQLRPGLRLGQICFFRVKGVQVPYFAKKYRKYLDSLGAGYSRIYEDP